MINHLMVNKTQLIRLCEKILKERIDDITSAMHDAQESANSEEKSSAGDKYETGRAMSHLNRDMYAVQLKAAQLQLQQLRMIDPDKEINLVSLGAACECDSGLYLIATGMGAISDGDIKAIILSPDSPLARALIGKKAGDRITFNGRYHLVKRVY